MICCANKNMFNFLRKKQKKEQEPAKNTCVCSILTGVPVQTRGRDNCLTGAGMQQLAWCEQILKDIGKKKGIKVKTMWGEQYMTKEDVEKHKASI